ncbi:MAG: PAS domain S-box protein [Hyphomicrobiales bacterium]
MGVRAPEGAPRGERAPGPRAPAAAWAEALLAPSAVAALSWILAEGVPLFDRPILLFLTVLWIAYRRPAPVAWLAAGLSIALVAARPWIPGMSPTTWQEGLVPAIVFALGSLAVVQMTARMRRLHAAVLAHERGDASRFHALMETSPEGVWRIDPEGRTLDVNRRMAAMLGYEPSEMIGRDFAAFADGAWVERAREACERCRKGDPLQFEFMFHDRAGHEVWTLMTTHPVLDESGRFLEGFGIVRDITERHRAEQERGTALSMLEATLNATADGVLVVDPEGKIVRWNDRFVRMWRLPDEILASRDDDRAIAFVLSQVVDPEAFAAKIRHLYATPDEESFDVLRFHDGRVFERFSIPQRSGGQLLGRVWTFRDVTDRERAIAEQRLALEREATIARNLDAALFTFVIDPATGAVLRHEHLTSGAEGLYGLTTQEMLADHDFWMKRVHPDDAREVVPPALEQLLRLEPASLEFRFATSRGIYRWHRARLLPRRGEDGLVYVDGLEADITDRVALEEQLRHSQKLEAVGQLAGGVAHDFNNILTAVLGYADLLLSRLPANDPHRRAVEEIRKGGDRAAALTRQLLAFSRRSPAQPRAVDLNEAMRELLPMLQRLAGEDIRFALDPAPGPARTRVDHSQLEQVVVNLVVNARDAMPEGGTIRIEIGRVAVTAADAASDPELIPGAYVRLTVTDTGTGIPDAVMQHIFEPFFTTKEPGRGTGLGLATIYGIVRQHRGRVRAVRPPEGGASFEILFPETEDVETKRPERRHDGSFPAGTERILLVEDDRSLLALGREILVELGYTVFTASSGNDALRVLEAQDGDVDLLVTDVVMPEMGGRELAAWATTRSPKLRVLYVSGYTKDSTLLQGIRDLEIAFLEKPYSPLALARRIRDVLDARRPVPAPTR